MEGLLIVVVIVLIIIVFVMMGTNRRLETIATMIKMLNNNMIDNHEKTLEAQKDILVCLQKMSNK